MKEEVLTVKQLRESIFENRNSNIILQGIREYVKRNENEYSLKQTFQLMTMIVGSTKLYCEDNPVKVKK